VLARAIEVNRLPHTGCDAGFFLSKRMNDKRKTTAMADTGIGHIERRHDARNGHMQIEQ